MDFVFAFVDFLLELLVELFKCLKFIPEGLHLELGLF